MPEPRIGDLRWRVTLARRSHQVSSDLSIAMPAVVYTNQRTVAADVRPVGTASFLAGQQLELGRITHRVTVRWQPTMVDADVVLRTTTTPDGQTRTDVYRVHRMEYLDGRQRWQFLDVELETTSP